MNLGKLKRTLHREFTRNPGKTCTLLGLLPVAGYFICPLVWKQFVPEAKGGGPSPIAVAVVENGSPGSVSGPRLPGWQELSEWIGQDARMRPAVVRSVRDPFRPVSQLAGAKAAAEQAGPPPSAASMRPEDCGLQLMATIIGPSRRLATISGRLYSEESRVPFGNARHSMEPPPDDQVFVLKSVAKDYVMLERQGELFRLQIDREVKN